MTDQEVLGQIGGLVDEEHRLWTAGSGRPLGPGEQTRLEAIHTELDVLWDLLRQRRARRRAGQDPDDAEERSANMVEQYTATPERE
ncbi:hypothetical protein DAETH_36630 (plasmid) [Deinococcus aetherius]|uniref:DUF2630 family protein n=1 Tax=Deinococcus aetherius TaxID=200252 RepID=A0ABN6RP94_9DEIO|nr:DUF2630 family protein [Deinococcus aetherius]BDP43694.1 hypothetical protein DAETH_36630 [Deinococcus aetherius]